MNWRKFGLTVVTCLLLVTVFVPAAVADNGKDSAPLGCVPSPMADVTFIAPTVLRSLPVSVDLRAGLPPVGNQGRQNSCVAWATGYYLKSYLEAREQQWDVAVAAHNYSPSYIYNQRPTTNCSLDRGMTIVAALQILQKGAATLSAMPYTMMDTCVKAAPAASASAVEYRNGTFAAVFQGTGRANTDAIKSLLAGGSPVVLGIPVYGNFKTATAAKPVIGVPPAGSSYLGGHAVLAVGYDSRGILIVNSWGTSWGDKGFAYLTYDFVRRYAFEGWVQNDVDGTAPTLPTSVTTVRTQGATPSADRLTFNWAGATDHNGSGIQSYKIYWGPNAQGATAIATVDSPSYTCAPVPAGQVYYLRIQVTDRAGNLSPWQTIYTSNSTK